MARNSPIWAQGQIRKRNQRFSREGRSRDNSRDNTADALGAVRYARPMRQQKLSVSGPRLVPVATPQPLPMRAERWFEEALTLARVVEALRAQREGADAQRPAQAKLGAHQ